MSARFDLALPDSVELYAVAGRKLALSVDGTKMLVVATKRGKVGLYLRRMDETEFRLVPGAEFGALGGNVDPTFSPDGETILFRANNELLRIPVSGAKAQRVDSSGAASWVDPAPATSCSAALAETCSPCRSRCAAPARS